MLSTDFRKYYRISIEFLNLKNTHHRSINKMSIVCAVVIICSSAVSLILRVEAAGLELSKRARNRERKNSIPIMDRIAGIRHI